MKLFQKTFSCYTRQVQYNHQQEPDLHPTKKPLRRFFYWDSISGKVSNTLTYKQNNFRLIHKLPSFLDSEKVILQCAKCSHFFITYSYKRKLRYAVFDSNSNSAFFEMEHCRLISNCILIKVTRCGLQHGLI